MEDDLCRTGLPHLGVEDIEKMKDLWRFSIRRSAAQTWAYRDIRFLVYDDADDEIERGTDHSHPIYDSDDEEATLQRAIAMSLETEQDSPGESPLHTETGPSNSERQPPNNDDPSARCDICCNVPEFPYNRKARTFRLISPASLYPNRELSKIPLCTHYVAVSYCWPEPVFDDQGLLLKTPVESKVRDLDGTVRDARALDDVLDRAVDFANCAGLRMIWIDQECLPQPTDQSPDEEKEYQQLGVQAMDLVYNRALVTVGLHAGSIVDQNQADALRTLISLDHIGELTPLPRLNSLILDYLYSFLGMVISDRWYTRAWIVQESISAGAGLFLSFRRGEGIDYPSSFRSSRNPPKHSLNLNPHLHSSQLINISVNDFRRLLRAAKRLVREQYQEIGITYHSAYGSSSDVLEHAELLHACPTASKFDFEMLGGNQYGSRQSVNASTSLTLLKSRQCRDAQDKIAIVANMCNYDIRLHTNLIAKNCTSLRVAMLTLALLNGDQSLLVPEVYSPSGSIDLNEEGIGYTELGLLSPFDVNPGAIYDHSMLQQGPLVPRASIHAFRDTLTQGLPLPAYIWIVDRELDLSPLKAQLAETWHAMKSLHIIVTRAKDESAAALISRQAAATRHFQNPTIMKEALWEILQHGCVPRDSTVWSGMDPTGIICTAHIDKANLEANPVAKRKLAGIIIYILAHLHRLARQDPQVAGVANSIWQSLRVDCTKEGSAGFNELPDVVCDELFTHIDVLLDSSSIFQLHSGPGSSYLQLWFIDRIMQHGTLWIGRYECGHNLDKLTTPWSSSTVEEESNIESPGKEETSNNRGGSPSAVSTQINGYARKSIVQRQTTRCMLTRMMDLSLFICNTKESTSSLLNIGSMVYFLDALDRGLWKAEADEARARDLVSVFDVDGPCTIATPFNAEWETLPNPSLRTMSVCWVVELLDGHAFSKMPEQEPEGKGKGKEEVKVANERFEAVEMMPAEDTPLYRVLHKVRGLWQLMDLPLGEILFI